MKDMFIDLAKYRVQRAFESKGDAEILLKSEKVTDSVNRIYQANFYGVKSLLALKMKDSPKHQIVLQTFQENYVLSGEIPKEYGQIVDHSYRSRDEGERRDQIKVTAREAHSLLADCERFLCFVREYLKQFILSYPRKPAEITNDEEECLGKKEEPRDKK
ncbi:MAG TPA: HEPN domain-containing protein [archaeon]|nr:HEPN domain-containing protein [archaeon]